MRNVKDGQASDAGNPPCNLYRPVLENNAADCFCYSEEKDNLRCQSSPKDNCGKLTVSKQAVKYREEGNRTGKQAEGAPDAAVDTADIVLCAGRLFFAFYQPRKRIAYCR